MKLPIFSLFFMILLSNLVLASEIDHFISEADLFEGGEAQCRFSVIMNYPASERITLRIFNEAKDIQTEANFKNFSCDVKKQVYGYDLDCDISKITNLTKSFKISYKASDLIRKINQKFLFQQQIYIPLSVNTFYSKVILPKAMALPEDSNQNFFPEYGKTMSDGSRISVYWTGANTTKNDLTMTVIYETSSEFPFILPIVAVIVILIVVISILLLRRSKKPKIDEVKFVLPVLKEDERKTVESLIAHNGFADQRLLVRETNYSKAKVSKILKNLQERNLIRLERIGRTNKVYLIRKEEKTT